MIPLLPIQHGSIVRYTCKAIYYESYKSSPVYLRFQISLSILFLREFTSLGASGGLFPSLVLGRSGKSYILYTLMNPL